MCFQTTAQALNSLFFSTFFEEQLENYREHFIRSSELLSLVRNLLSSQRCIPLNKILSELWITPDEAKYHLRKVAKSTFPSR